MGRVRAIAARDLLLCIALLAGRYACKVYSLVHLVRTGGRLARQRPVLTGRDTCELFSIRIY